MIIALSSSAAREGSNRLIVDFRSKS